jgi:hypothetical protein
MKLDDVGETIAVRRLNLLRDGESPTKVLVLLGKPKQLRDHCDFYCPYQIKGAGDEKVRYSCGIDAFQSLQLVIWTAGVELEVINKNLAGKLGWEGDEKGCFGFPEPQDRDLK